MDTTRLDRIEEKIDKLNEAALAVVRIEERLIASTKRVERLEYRADEQEDDLSLLERQVANNTNALKTSERFMWILITVCATALIYTFQGNS
tara:strand:- start:10879 stop:11154 length:276 start_codon:yes stop_codon:yes gene_type:complete